VAEGDGQLRGFAIRGEYGDYVWADATIVERSNGWKFWQKRQLVQVRSDQISEPKSVKYGWADNPDMINLYNKEGLPASPFSTD
jgi:sialate O-acetylesterase